MTAPRMEAVNLKRFTDELRRSSVRLAIEREALHANDYGSTGYSARAQVATSRGASGSTRSTVSPTSGRPAGLALEVAAAAPRAPTDPR